MFEFQGRGYALGDGRTVHGLVAERNWQVVGTPTSSSVTLAVPIGPDFPGGWPFDGLIRQAIRVGGTGLLMRLEVHCLDRPMPAIAVFHPWFRRRLGVDRAATVNFSPGRRIIFRDGGHRATPDLGPRPWDDLFVDLAGPPSIRGPTVTMMSNAPIWVYYERMPQGFCIEPWTGPFNGLSTPWASVVSPGNPLVLELALRISSAQQPAVRWCESLEGRTSA